MRPFSRQIFRFSQRPFGSAISPQEEMSKLLSQFASQPMPPTVLKQTGNVAYVNNPDEGMKFLDIVSFSGKDGAARGLCLSLMEDEMTALMLSTGESVVGAEVATENGKLTVQVRPGSVQTALGEPIQENEFASGTEAIDLDMSLLKSVKAPYLRQTIDKQLLTGHVRIDLLQPLAQCNMTMIKGEPNSGKSAIAHATIEQFLTESEDNWVVHVTLSSQKAGSVLATCGNPERLFSIAVKDQANDAEVYLAPFTALHAATHLRDQGKNVLFVFEDALRHQFKERYIFDLAS